MIMSSLCKDWKLKCGILFALSTYRLLNGLALLSKDVTKLPRLFLDEKLSVGKTYLLGSDSSHYIKNVMRFKTGFYFRTFNHEGEYLAQVISTMKSREVTICVAELIRKKDDSEVFPCVLYCAPLKKQRYKQLVEKCTELGVSHIVPVLTKYTIASTINEGEENLNSIIISSSEQSERLSLPVLHDPINIADLLAQWKATSATSGKTPFKLMVCRERFPRGKPLINAIELLPFMKDSSASVSMQELPGGASGFFGLFIGPEGGFSEEEQLLMERADFIEFVTLGPNVLRAETAAISALSVVAAKVESLVWHDNNKAPP